MVSRKAIEIEIAILWSLLSLGSAVLGQVHKHSTPGKPHQLESVTLEMLDELDNQAKATQRTGEDVDLRSSLSQDQGDDLWSGVLQVTRLDNPFLSRECRLEAVGNARKIMGPAKAQEHGRKHFDDWKKVLRGTKRISLNEYLNHILNCKDFCAPYIGALLKCHTEGVGQSSHGNSLVITFGIGLPEADEEFEFSAGERAQISAFALRMRAAGKKIVIEARASILDETESLRSNLDLSERRGSLMKSALVTAGFRAEDILVKSLCWEPPRLAIEEVAAAYGFTAVRSSLSNPQYMDQSVVLLGYLPGGD